MVGVRIATALAITLVLLLWLQPPPPATAAPTARQRAATAAHRRQVRADARATRALRRHERRLEEAANAQEADFMTAETARDAANGRYERALNAYSEHIVELYKADDTHRMSALIAARNLGDALSTATIIYQLSEYDRRLLDEYNAAIAESDALGVRADDAMAQLAETTAQLDQVRHELAAYEPDDPKPANRGDGAGVAPEAQHFFTTGPLPGLLGMYGGGSAAGSIPTLTPTGGGSAPVTPPKGLRPSGQAEEGVASWYGPGFHGEQTANGETYDMYALTAAHRTLPFGTWVKVTAGNGESVVVRINDRGPYVDGRTIDLSYAAAQAIGIDSTAPVTVETLA